MINLGVGIGNREKFVNQYLATVLIPVKNGANFLEFALQSVLEQQTEYSFAVLVVNDHSTDETLEIVRRQQLKYENLRLAHSLDYGVGNAIKYGLTLISTKYVLRLDADDLMVNGRIQKQISFMENNPDCYLLGSQISPIGNQRVNSYPLVDKDIRLKISHGNTFADPAVIFRHDATKDVCIFKGNIDGAEQYEYWLQLSSLGEMYNLNEVLTLYRIHDQQFTKIKTRKVLWMTLFVQLEWATNFSQFSLKRRAKLFSRSIELLHYRNFWSPAIMSIKYLIRSYL
jgi:glycosyltransferase involved in cell wall biosynthesis